MCPQKGIFIIMLRLKDAKDLTYNDGFEDGCNILAATSKLGLAIHGR